MLSFYNLEVSGGQSRLAHLSGVIAEWEGLLTSGKKQIQGVNGGQSLLPEMLYRPKV